MACSKGYASIVELLLDAGEDLDRTTKGGSTPLFLASRKAKLSVAQLLVERGASVNMCRKGMNIKYMNMNMKYEYEYEYRTHTQILDHKLQLNHHF